MTMRSVLMFLTLAGVLAGVSAPVAAVDLTVRFTGEFKTRTCDWSLGDGNRTITLNPIEARALPGNGAAGFKQFNLNLENCSDDVTSATFSFTGTPDSDEPLRYKNSGDAKGVAIELQSMDGQTVGANGTDNARTTAVVAGRTVLKLNAAYWRIGSVELGTGSVSSVATVTMSYN
jgi:type 1 fimbria pilin